MSIAMKLTNDAELYDGELPLLFNAKLRPPEKEDSIIAYSDAHFDCESSEQIFSDSIWLSEYLYNTGIYCREFRFNVLADRTAPMKGVARINVEDSLFGSRPNFKCWSIPNKAEIIELEEGYHVVTKLGGSLSHIGIGFTGLRVGKKLIQRKDGSARSGMLLRKPTSLEQERILAGIEILRNLVIAVKNNNCDNRTFYLT